MLPQNIFLSLVVFTVALLSVSSAFSQNAPPDMSSLTAEQLRTLSIRFERTGCYGNCPAYTLTIHGNGQVEYEGLTNVKKTGKASGTIEDADLRAILSAFAKSDFYSVGENVSQSKCTCRQCTDLPTIRIAIEVAGSGHKVDHYHGCGCATKELWKLEDEIDRIVKTSQWTGDVSKAGPYGMTCWDPPPTKPKQ